MSKRAFHRIQSEIVACERCPRLRAHCEAVAAKRRPMYAEWEYWGKPVPSFGDPGARFLIIGLAPAAHGANRTGRMFTGDSSGDWLYEALHRYGFANQPQSTECEDGLRLTNCAVSATCHCAPPDNKPSREEMDACRPYLHAEIAALEPALILVLGRIAWDGYLRILTERGVSLPRPRPGFSHGGLVELPAGPPVLQSYHPSRQNTNTGRLTRKMWHGVFAVARRRLNRLDS